MAFIIENTLNLLFRTFSLSSARHLPKQMSKTKRLTNNSINQQNNSRQNAKILRNRKPLQPEVYRNIELRGSAQICDIYKHGEKYAKPSLLNNEAAKKRQELIIAAYAQRQRINAKLD